MKIKYIYKGNLNIGGENFDPGTVFDNKKHRSIWKPILNLYKIHPERFTVVVDEKDIPPPEPEPAEKPKETPPSPPPNNTKKK